MILFSEEFARKDFTADSMKKAYMDACKWYASNILSNDILKDINVSFEKLNESQPTIRIHLVMPLKLSVVKKNHCDICKETHKMFYLNDNVDCNRCKINAFEWRMTEMLKNKKAAYRETLSKILGI